MKTKLKLIHLVIVSLNIVYIIIISSSLIGIFKYIQIIILLFIFVTIALDYYKDKQTKIINYPITPISSIERLKKQDIDSSILDAANVWFLNNKDEILRSIKTAPIGYCPREGLLNKPWDWKAEHWLWFIRYKGIDVV